MPRNQQTIRNARFPGDEDPLIGIAVEAIFMDYLREKYGQRWKWIPLATELRDHLFKRFPFCIYCNRRRSVVIDHMDPLELGGPDRYCNSAPACKTCNSKKSDQSLLSWLPKLPEDAQKRVRAFYLEQRDTPPESFVAGPATKRRRQISKALRMFSLGGSYEKNSRVISVPAGSYKDFYGEVIEYREHAYDPYKYEPQLLPEGIESLENSQRALKVRFELFVKYCDSTGALSDRSALTPSAIQG